MEAVNAAADLERKQVGVSPPPSADGRWVRLDPMQAGPLHACAACAVRLLLHLLLPRLPLLPSPMLVLLSTATAGFCMPTAFCNVAQAEDKARHEWVLAGGLSGYLKRQEEEVSHAKSYAGSPPAYAHSLAGMPAAMFAAAAAVHGWHGLLHANLAL
jgi:hypothetical protein